MSHRSVAEVVNEGSTALADHSADGFYSPADTAHVPSRGNTVFQGIIVRQFKT